MRLDRQTWLAALMLLGVLLTGVALGAALDRAWTAQLGPRPPPERRPPPPDQVADMFRLQLQLDDRQAAHVRAVLDEDHARNRALMDEVQPRLRAGMEASQLRIRAVLTPAQAERFDRMTAEHPPPWGPPPPPPPPPPPR